MKSNPQTQIIDHILEVGSYNDHLIQLVVCKVRVYDCYYNLSKEVKYQYEVRIFFAKNVSYLAKNYIFDSLENARAFFNRKNDCKEEKEKR